MIRSERSEVFHRERGCFRPGAMIALSGAAAFLLTGCLSPTQSTIEEYDASGKIVRKTVTSESVIKNLVDSTKDKSVVVWDNSWLAYISASAATTEDPTPTVKMGVGRADKGALTLHKDHSIDQAAAIIGAARAGEISVSATGVSEKSTDEKKTAAATVAASENIE